MFENFIKISPAEDLKMITHDLVLEVAHDVAITWRLWSFAVVTILCIPQLFFIPSRVIL